MALFQKKPKVGTHAPVYTLGNQKSLLIVGLGNIGKEYEDTRHNIGFRVVNVLREKLDFTAWSEKKNFKALFSMGLIGSTRVLLIKPTTMMNLSGEAIQAVCQFYKLLPSDVIVVHDELDIPFGQIRSTVGGSSAGHNGIKSVIAHLGEDFGRVRIGIGPKRSAQIDSADFVLASFSSSEVKQLPNLLKESTALLTECVYAGGSLTTETRSIIV